MPFDHNRGDANFLASLAGLQREPLARERDAIDAGLGIAVEELGRVSAHERSMEADDKRFEQGLIQEGERNRVAQLQAIIDDELENQRRLEEILLNANPETDAELIERVNALMGDSQRVVADARGKITPDIPSLREGRVAPARAGSTRTDVAGELPGVADAAAREGIVAGQIADVRASYENQLNQLNELAQVTTLSEEDRLLVERGVEETQAALAGLAEAEAGRSRDPVSFKRFGELSRLLGAYGMSDRQIEQDEAYLAKLEEAIQAWGPDVDNEEIQELLADAHAYFEGVPGGITYLQRLGAMVKTAGAPDESIAAYYESLLMEYEGHPDHPALPGILAAAEAALGADTELYRMLEARTANLGSEQALLNRRSAEAGVAIEEQTVADMQAAADIRDWNAMLATGESLGASVHTAIDRGDFGTISYFRDLVQRDAEAVTDEQSPLFNSIYGEEAIEFLKSIDDEQWAAWEEEARGNARSRSLDIESHHRTTEQLIRNLKNESLTSLLEGYGAMHGLAQGFPDEEAMEAWIASLTPEDIEAIGGEEALIVLRGTFDLYDRERSREYASQQLEILLGAAPSRETGNWEGWQADAVDAIMGAFGNLPHGQGISREAAESIVNRILDQEDVRDVEIELGMWSQLAGLAGLAQGVFEPGDGPDGVFFDEFKANELNTYMNGIVTRGKADLDAMFSECSVTLSDNVLGRQSITGPDCTPEMREEMREYWNREVKPFIEPLEEMLFGFYNDAFFGLERGTSYTIGYRDSSGEVVPVDIADTESLPVGATQADVFKGAIISALVNPGFGLLTPEEAEAFDKYVNWDAAGAKGGLPEGVTPELVEFFDSLLDADGVLTNYVLGEDLSFDLPGGRTVTIPHDEIQRAISPIQVSEFTQVGSVKMGPSAFAGELDDVYVAHAFDQGRASVMVSVDTERGAAGAGVKNGFNFPLQMIDIGSYAGEDFVMTEILPGEEGVLPEGVRSLARRLGFNRFGFRITGINASDSSIDASALARGGDPIVAQPGQEMITQGSSRRFDADGNAAPPGIMFELVGIKDGDARSSNPYLYTPIGVGIDGLPEDAVGFLVDTFFAGVVPQGSFAPQSGFTPSEPVEGGDSGKVEGDPEEVVAFPARGK